MNQAGRNYKLSLRHIVSTSALIAGLWSGQVLAQAEEGTLAPVRYKIDQNGVNVATGEERSINKILSIGSGDSELAYYMPSGGYSYDLNISGTLSTSTVVTAEYLGSEGRASKRFSRSGNTFTALDGDGATLTLTGSTYVMTLADGTKYTWGYIAPSVPGFQFYGLSKISYPNSRELNIQWVSTSYCQNADAGCNNSQLVNLNRLQSVTSSDGYQLHYKYGRDADPERALQATAWRQLVRVDAINLAVDYCAPAQGDCAYSQSWPSLTLSAAGSTATDLLGRVTTVTTGIEDGGSYVQYKRPGAASANKIVHYDSARRVTSVVMEDRTYQYAFSLSGTTMTMVRKNPDQTTRTIVSDTNVGLPTSVTDEAGNVTRYLYDTYGRLQYVVSPEGKMNGAAPAFGYTLYEYDTRGNVIKTTVVAKESSGLANLVTSAGYPACTTGAACNRPVWTKDALERQTDYTYDNTHGGVLTVTRPADPNGVRPQVRYTYAPKQAYYKNATGSIVASGVSRYVLTGQSTCLSASGANPASCVGTASETRATIDYGPQAAGTANNLLPRSSAIAAGDNSLSATSSFAYDNVGNVTAVDGPLAGNADTTVYKYDAVRQLVGIIGPDPDGDGEDIPLATRVTYNADGQVTQQELGTVTAQTDAAWSAFQPLEVYTTGYDASARPTSRSVSAGGTVFSRSQASYDTMGRIKCAVTRLNVGATADACTPTAGVGGSDRVAQATYDSVGRIVAVTEGFGSLTPSTSATTYTPNGKVKTVLDSENNLTTYEYDGFDRLSKTRYPVANKGANTSSGTDYEEFIYGDNVRITSLRLRDASSMALGYDALDRLTSRAPAGEGVASMTYNLVGQMISSSRNGTTLTNAYDALGRLTSEGQAYGSMSYLYDLAGQPTRLTWGGSDLYIDYSYDSAGRLVRVSEKGATSGIGVLATFSYDALWRRAGVIYGNGTSRTYKRDAIGRLAGLKIDLAGAAGDLVIGEVDNVGSAISYNPASQIVGLSRSNDIYAFGGTYNGSRAYVSNGLNQYTTVGSLSYGYDARGNLTYSGASSYGYSKLNELVSAPGVSMAYDPVGRLQTFTSGATTRMVYAGQNLVTELSGSNGGVLRRYVPVPGSDEIITWYEGAGTTDRRFLQADERGSILAVSDTSGSLIAANSYDEYGIPASTNVGRFQFTGQTWFPELGMYNFKARIYSPTLGRFMQTDPIGYADGLNWYNYVGGDPVNNTDPMGLDACSQSEIDAMLHSGMLKEGEIAACSGGGGGVDFGNGFLGLGGADGLVGGAGPNGSNANVIVVSASSQSNPICPSSAFADVLGKAGALPVTLAGLIGGYALGAAQEIAGGSSAHIGVGNNAIQISELTVGDPVGFTLGNVQLYGGGSGPGGLRGRYDRGRAIGKMGVHEEGHTYQFQGYSPAYMIYQFTASKLGDSRVNALENEADNYADRGPRCP